MFSAFLDTSVLWPSRQRDFLLSLAVEGLYRPLWSSAILDELSFHEQAKLVGRGVDDETASGKAAWLLDQMQRVFPDACASGWEPLEGSYGLPDPDDEHVVAAAVVGGAGVIVTDNTADFPDDRVPDGIDVVTARVFITDTVTVSPRAALTAAEAVARRLANPPMQVTELLSLLETRYGLVEAVGLLRQALDDIGQEP